MSGFVDLHLHYLPAVDDGVRTHDDAITVLSGLRALGFERAVATPHIRPGMFPNRRAPLLAAFSEFERSVAGRDDLPRLGLGAEHWVDDSLLLRVAEGDVLPYPGGRAILVELPPTAIPLGFPDLCFRLRTKGMLPVLAHPERYTALADRTDALDPLLDQGMATLLDLMSLVGRYGRAAQRAAERMVDEGTYDAACSDTHRVEDLELVGRAIATLERRAGRDEARRLLVDGPTRILAGSLDS